MIIVESPAEERARILSEYVHDFFNGRGHHRVIAKNALREKIAKERERKDEEWRAIQEKAEANRMRKAIEADSMQRLLDAMGADNTTIDHDLEGFVKWQGGKP